jgi:DNA-binding CsgD family transcriptional regulator
MSAALRPRMANWSEAETAQLRELAAQRLSRNEIARIMGRPPGTVDGKMAQLRIRNTDSKKRGKPWTEAAERKALALHREGKNYVEIGTIMGYHKASVREHVLAVERGKPEPREVIQALPYAQPSFFTPMTPERLKARLMAGR